MKNILKKLLSAVEELDSNASPDTVAKFIRNQYQAGNFDDNDCQVLSIIYESSLKEKYRQSKQQDGQKIVKLTAQLADY